MQFPLKLICNKRVIRKNGCCNIYIQYCHSAKQRTLLNSGIAIPPEFWDPKKLKVYDYITSQFGNASEINDSLFKIVRKAEDLLLFAKKEQIENSLEFLKEKFRPDFDTSTLAEIKFAKDVNNPKVNKDFFFQVDNYTNSKLKRVSKDMGRIYRNMKDHLKAFELFRRKSIHFDDLDLTFYEDLVDFLSYNYVIPRRKDIKIGLKYNTVGKTIKHLRAFLHDRKKKKIIPTIDMDGWKVLEVETDAVYCNERAVSKLLQLDLSDHPHLVDYRDDFVFGCMTGLRFSDFSLINEHDLRGDMLYKKQKKSNHWVVIPLRPTALKILKERFTKNILPSHNSKFNKHIKTIAALAGINTIITFSYKKGNQQINETKPKYEWICSHTCRRSFCTNEFLAGTPPELIMKISGHKSITDFYKYIRISPEEAANKIKMIWSQRDSNQTIVKI
jgi:hypothetical protein